MRTWRLKFAVLALAALSCAFPSCSKKIPKDALRLSPESLRQRQLQTRRFETTDEAMMLSACAALLQDLGFNLDESDVDVGFVVASKDRTAVEAGQVAAATAILLLTAVVGAPTMIPTDERQKLRASVVTRPIGEQSEHIAVRVTFQRVVWNTENEVSKREAIDDPKAYQEFFEMLSKSVFLEAHDL